MNRKWLLFPHQESNRADDGRLVALDLTRSGQLNLLKTLTLPDVTMDFFSFSVLLMTSDEPRRASCAVMTMGGNRYRLDRRLLP